MQDGADALGPCPSSPWQTAQFSAKSFAPAAMAWGRAASGLTAARSRPAVPPWRFATAWPSCWV